MVRGILLTAFLFQKRPLIKFFYGTINQSVSNTVTANNDVRTVLYLCDLFFYDSEIEIERI